MFATVEIASTITANARSNAQPPSSTIPIVASNVELGLSMHPRVGL